MVKTTIEMIFLIITRFQRRKDNKNIEIKILIFFEGFGVKICHNKMNYCIKNLSQKIILFL